MDSDASRMKLSGEILIRFDDTANNFCINFTATIFLAAKLRAHYAYPLPMFTSG